MQLSCPSGTVGGGDLGGGDLGDGDLGGGDLGGGDLGGGDLGGGNASWKGKGLTHRRGSWPNSRVSPSFASWRRATSSILPEMEHGIYG